MKPARALILAAGRGERMRPLTDRTPKPLLTVRGKRLIEWHLEALSRAGVRDVVINTAWLEAQFPAALGDGSRYGVAIRYSTEGRDHGGALETGGGIKKALPWLADAFWVVGGDVWLPDFAFAPEALRTFERGERLAQLWLADNPPHHPAGDFGLRDGLATFDPPRYTWASVGLFRAAFVTELMDGVPVGTKAPLRPYLDAAIARGALGAERLVGRWTDVGTTERLAALDRGAEPALSAPIGPHMTINRRSSERKALRSPVAVELPRGVRRDAAMWDVGLQGLCLVTAKPIAPGTRCSVAFELPLAAGPQALRADARVVYCSYTGPSAFKVGLLFAALDTASERAIDEFVQA